MSPGIAVFVAVLLLIANAFFVAVEFGLIATQRAHLEEHLAAGNKRARTALNAVTNLNTQIAGAQLGITMASIALGLVAEPSVAKILESTVLSGLSKDAQHTVGLIIALSLVTFLHILVGEMVPKNLALADAARTSMALAPLHGLFVRVTGPLISLLNWLSNQVLRLFGVSAVDERADAKTPEELSVLIATAHEDDVLDGYDYALLSSTLELGAATIRDGVVPWAQVDTTPDSIAISDIERAMAASGHSRLITLGSDGEPSGWLHAKDLLGSDPASWNQPLPAGYPRDLVSLDIDTPAEDALALMQTQKMHVALATENGTRVGLITLEDVLKVLSSGLASARDAAAATDQP